MAQIVIDTDSFAQTLSTREDCGNKTGCICPADEACQWPKLAMRTPVLREDLEMPERGE